jgi:hypothetical protein
MVIKFSVYNHVDYLHVHVQFTGLCCILSLSVGGRVRINYTVSHYKILLLF